MFPEVLTEDLRLKAGDLVVRLGDRLGAEGYQGFFEVDVVVDTDTDEVYLGELNPRISGASAITNVTAGTYADIPLFAFHLLEFFDVAFEIAPLGLNGHHGRGPDRVARGGRSRCIGRQQEVTVHIEGVQ